MAVAAGAGIGATAIVGGLGLGLVALYLVSGEKGKQRRQRIAQAAYGAAHAAADAVQQSVHSVKGSAEHLMHGAVDAVKHQVDQAGSAIHERLSSAHDQAREMAREHVNNAVRSAGLEEKSHTGLKAAGVTTATLSAAVIGAGAVYFLDPDHGEQRRSSALNMIFSLVRATAEHAREYGRLLAGHLSGGSEEEATDASTEEGNEAGESTTERSENLSPSVEAL